MKMDSLISTVRGGEGTNYKPPLKDMKLQAERSTGRSY